MFTSCSRSLSQSAARRCLDRGQLGVQHTRAQEQTNAWQQSVVKLKSEREVSKQAAQGRGKRACLRGRGKALPVCCLPSACSLVQSTGQNARRHRKASRKVPSAKSPHVGARCRLCCLLQRGATPALQRTAPLQTPPAGCHSSRVASGSACSSESCASSCRACACSRACLALPLQ